MLIYKEGTEVITVVGSLKGLITAVTIRGGYATYEVSYLNDGQIITTWLSEIEFKTDSEKTVKIGYK